MSQLLHVTTLYKILNIWEIAFASNRNIDETRLKKDRECQTAVLSFDGSNSGKILGLLGKSTVCARLSSIISPISSTILLLLEISYQISRLSGPHSPSTALPITKHLHMRWTLLSTRFYRFHCVFLAVEMDSFFTKIITVAGQLSGRRKPI